MEVWYIPLPHKTRMICIMQRQSIFAPELCVADFLSNRLIHVYSCAVIPGLVQTFISC